MTVLKFLRQEVFYNMLKQSRSQAFIGVDFGEKSTGLCIGYLSTNTLHPILSPGNWNGYVLSPLEHLLNQHNTGLGAFDGNWFVPDQFFSPQVLSPTTMAVSEMREVLNALVAANDIEFYVFGFSADSRFWNDDSNYSFIRKQLQDFEDDQQLASKYFTFVDESNSTGRTNDYLNRTYPEFSDHVRFMAKYPWLAGQIRSFPRYDLFRDPSDKHLKTDLSGYHKRMLDSYAACCFCWDFLDRCSRSKFDGAAVQSMERYARRHGYAPVENPQPNIVQNPQPNIVPGRGRGRVPGRGRGRV